MMYLFEFIISYSPLDNLNKNLLSDLNVFCLLDGEGLCLSAFIESVNGDKASVIPRDGLKIFNDSISTVVSVFYDRTFQVVSPGGALNSIHKENMIRVQDEVVHKTRGVTDLGGT
jgi:hypothetical protein